MDPATVQGAPWAGSCLGVDMAELWGEAEVERDDGRWISSTIGPTPGVGGEDGSDSIIAKVLFLTMSKHDSMKSRSFSRMSPGPERKSGRPGLHW